MSRILLVLLMLAATAGAVVAYGDPERIERTYAFAGAFDHRAVPIA